jgi:glycosyltransferase involved in cell wall biosynthesis
VTALGRSDGAEVTAFEPELEFSIVTAVYNVESYLGEFIESIEAQSYQRDRFEVIAVDDGSTDDSLAIIQAWEARRPGFVRVVTKENGGQASARNLGLDHVRGRWVTFPDPDDILRPDYLAEVAAFLSSLPVAPTMVATNRLILNDATGEVTDTHPLWRQFAHGNRTRNLDHYPEYFHGSAPAAFFAAAEIRRLGLRFSTEIRPNWEDGHFCSKFLLGAESPIVGFVATAHYLYRKRQDNSSTLQSSFAHAGRFTTVLERGFIDALDAGARRAGGRPPEWLQSFVVYELSWYLSSQEAHAGVATGATEDVAQDFHRLMAKVLSYIDKDVIAGFTIRPLKANWVDILLHAYEPEPWHQPYGHVAAYDSARALVRVTYQYTGAAPREEVFSGGQLVAPTHSKVRDLVYYDRVLMRERIMWVSARQSLRVRLDGRDLDLQFRVLRRNHVLRPGQMKERLLPRPAWAAAARRRKPPLADRIIRRAARLRLVRRRFRNAWVLMDRISDAGDSAERLFEYLRANRPDIHAWFVVARDGPDWARLRRRYGGRVLAHGSWRWKMVMANCRHLISSHIDVPIVKPPALTFLRPTWQFTFLQHGVIKDDLSAWLNTKPMDLFVTSTPQEYTSIVADHTPYVFTTKEVKLTGLPRFDRLLEMGARFADRRDLVLVAPTWRVRLVRPLEPGAHTRDIDPAFFGSEFARNWLGVLRSEALATLCEERGLTIAFLPHPVLQPALPHLELPKHVRGMSFADNDVQELFARSAVMVTDYSSMAFNAAYIERPLVYFQFDHADIRAGDHLGRRGYFDYERDGFGPVAYTLPAAIAAIVEVVRRGPSPMPTYRSRIEATFPLRDGRCSERVVTEIEAMSRRLSPAEAAIPISAPRLPEVSAPST